MGRIVIDNLNACITIELATQIARKRRIELKKKELTIGPHSARDFARMHAFARTVLRDHMRPIEVNFIGHALNQRPRTGDNGGNLKGTLEKSLEEKGAHPKTNSHPQPRHCPVASAWRATGASR